MAYPDSATLLRVREFLETGLLYPNINLPPYQVTIYGPLSYVLMAVFYGAAKGLGLSPVIVARLYDLGCLSVCLLLIFRISRKLYGSGAIAWVSIIFALSAFPLAVWTTQMRPDLPGLAFSLLGVYAFVLARRGPVLVGSAACAGLSLLCKQTFFAAPIAITGSLLIGRQYVYTALWIFLYASTVGAGYAIAWLHEPLITQHIAALRHPVFEFDQAVRIIFEAASQPVVPFAVLGTIFTVWNSGNRDRTFFAVYCGFSWAIAIATIPQAGSNFNYFWEPLLVSAVLAGPGLFVIPLKAISRPMTVVATLCVLLTWSFLPALRHGVGSLRQAYLELREYPAQQMRWNALLSVISGRQMLSTWPSITFHSKLPEVPDPFLNEVLELKGAWSYAPVIRQIDDRTYELIVIGRGQSERSDDFRGIRIWPDAVWVALKRTYQLSCLYQDYEIWLPREASKDSSSKDLQDKLEAIGCSPGAKQL